MENTNSKSSNLDIIRGIAMARQRDIEDAYHEAGVVFTEPLRERLDYYLKEEKENG